MRHAFGHKLAEGAKTHILADGKIQWMDLLSGKGRVVLVASGLQRIELLKQKNEHGSSIIGHHEQSEATCAAV